MAEKHPLSALTVFAEGISPSTELINKKGFLLIPFPDSHSFMQKLNEEGIQLGPEILQAFGFVDDLRWYIAQAEGDSTFISYGLPSGAKPHVQEAIVTIGVDRYWVGKQNNPDIRIAGISSHGKKSGTSYRDVIIAAEYENKSGEIVEANVGVKPTDVPHFNYLLDYHMGIIHVPTDPEEPISQTGGLVTSAMVQRTGDHHTLLMYSDVGPLHMQFTSQIEDYMRLVLAKDQVTLNYTHPNVNANNWSVSIPAKLK